VLWARAFGRTTTGRLVAAAAALGAAWLVAPAAVPLYDGIGFPDEPYRYVDPPAGYRKTPPATRALGSVPAGGATSRTPGGGSTGAAAERSVSTRDIGIKSGEYGPQVEMYVAKGSLTGPAGTRGYQISAMPVAPGRPAPAGGQVGADVRIDGDVYRVKITCLALPPAAGPGPAPGGRDCPATIAAHGFDGVAWIALRATSARRPAPVFLYRPAPAAPWRILPARRGGRDFYTAALVGEGDYALTFTAAPRSPGAAPAGSSKSAGGPPTVVIALVVVLAGLTVIIGVIRFTRTRQRP